MKLLALAGRRMVSWTGALALLTGAISAYTQQTYPNIQISIASPTNDSSFTAPTNIEIDAMTVDTNANDIVYVQFTATRGGHGIRPLYVINLGKISNGVPTGGPGSNQELYSLTWSNVPIGTWLLTAQAVTTNDHPWLNPISPPVEITVGPDTDLSVDIATPTNGATFSAPADIQLIAGATASVGAVASVEFFDGTNDLGIDTFGAVVDPPGSPGLTPGGRAFFLTWSNAPVGFHVLTALATDTNGETAISDPIFITVTTTNNPTTLSVGITEPANHSSYITPANIVIDAVTVDTNDDVAEVSFFASPHGISVLPIVLYLGTVSNGVPTGPSGSHEELFTLIWSNAPVGAWDVTAHAFSTNDPSERGAVSSPVEITITLSTDISVDIATPTNGTVFTAPTDIQLIAGASATVGEVASVQFFDGLTSLGIVSNGVVVDPPGSPGLAPGSLAYSLTWSNAPVGLHFLTAVATDTNGESAVSAQVVITVITNFPPPPPVVRITSPPNNSVFSAPVNITLFAFAFDGDESVSNVQFYAGTNSLGFGVPVLFYRPGPVMTNGPQPWPPVFPTNVFELIWSNPAPSTNMVTAVAEFATGAFATSAPVDITVTPQPPPPTNRPDVVNITATDPIAIEGTNCWTWLGLTNTHHPTWSGWMSPDALCGWFTNCGPADATFSVRRWGETNDDLTVDYSISGTASNGVDYVLLTGTVDIPAGQREATITIVPIDVDTNPAPDTVILTLSPSTNSSPDYHVGFPSSAEALILNSASPLPRLTGRELHDHTFCLSMTGPDGGWFRIDYSTNCTSWTPVCTNQVVSGLINFADPNAAGSPARWYRAVPLPNGPNY